MMKPVALVLLAVALATVNARRLSWEDMAGGDMSMGYPVYPGAGALPTYPGAYPAQASAGAKAVASASAAAYPHPYPARYPAYPVDPKVDTEEEEDKPHPGCFFKTDFSCEPKKCGDEECKFPNKCATVKKLVEKEVVVDVPCRYPKLACKEIATTCGPEEDGLKCKFDETCESEEVCEKKPYAYGPYFKLVCKDKFSCKKIDPTVCETVEHKVCISRDPKAADPGFYNGYSLGWVPDWKFGMKCGDKVCQYGSYCATCEVEVCKENVIPKEAAKCGFDPAKKVPTFCPPGHMCVELCPQIKKKVTEVVEEEVCVSPYDAKYPVAYQPVVCGDKKCAPGYECKEETCELCPYYYPYGYASPEDNGDDSAVDPTYGYGYPAYGYPYPTEAATAGDEMTAGPTYGYPDYTAYPYPYPTDIATNGDDMTADPKYAYIPQPYPYPEPTDLSSNGGSDDPHDYYVVPADISADKKVDPHYDYLYLKPDVAAEDDGKKSTAFSSSKATATPDEVTVWGTSKTTGDGSASFKAKATVPDDKGADKLFAKITGSSGPGDDGAGVATVNCGTKSSDGTANCDGTASHDED